MKKQNGITLIALIITVIVLLILAGITINLTIGEDGIIKRAEQAGKNYVQATKNEETELAEFTNLTDRLIDNATKNHYTIVEGVPVPKGFTHIAGTKDTGFVIKNDTDGNEFVWVPCTIDGANGSVKYDRYAFTKDEWTNNQTIDSTTGEIKQGTSTIVWTETMPTDEKTSVKTYGGFYIGRYESGITGHDKNVLTENTNKLTEWTGYKNGKLVIQRGQQVWNYITRNQAKIESEKLYTKRQGDSVNSRLCSSYAWDTVLKFIEIKNTGYATSGIGGNYYDLTFSYTDLEGASQTKASKTAVLVPTGQTTAVKNIYDMGGNAWEWTTENVFGDPFCFTPRGGNYDRTSSKDGAAARSGATSIGAAKWNAFRVTLYL